MQTVTARFAHGAPLDVYQQRRHMREIPIHTSTGADILLSLGKHSRLQALVRSGFGPQYPPVAALLSPRRDTHKIFRVGLQTLDPLSILLTEHDKLPDAVLCDEVRSWQLLVEAAISKGSMSNKRAEELTLASTDCVASRQFVNTFLHFRQLTRLVDKTAWETEVSDEEISDNLFNITIDDMLGPRRTTDPKPQSHRF